jgi:hypothetical protein
MATEDQRFQLAAPFVVLRIISNAPEISVV